MTAEVRAWLVFDEQYGLPVVDDDGRKMVYTDQDAAVIYAVKHGFRLVPGTLEGFSSKYDGKIAVHGVTDA